MKVLHVMGSLGGGGAEAMVMNLFRNIDRDVIQFDFVVHTEDIGVYEKEAIGLGATIYRCPRYRGKNHLSYKRWWKDFFVNHRDYDIVHSHIRSSAIIYYPEAKKAGAKFIIHCHSTSNTGDSFAKIKDIMQFPMRYKADYFFACSRAAGEWMFGKKVVESDKFQVLYNAIDIERYRFDERKRENCRNELGFTGKKIYLHVGSLYPVKNHAFLLDVFYEIKRRQDDSVLILAGTGGLRETIENRIQELKLQDSVKLLGFRIDIPDLMMAADVFLFPSIYEGLGIVVIEAQATGLPCIVSEAVPDEAILTNLVHKQPINQGVEKWVVDAISMTGRRKDMINIVRQAGYDIIESSKKIEGIYCKLVNGD